ncbi:hypothetical protein DPMN_164865 [Dreissena polymorpha]|uniref:Uncharacterized protein n=1 Tax=Dreissena polymorpha TaxID=45954 RepID=A0A9D4ISQ8_DREPO|nr:hypothetical protein DPMN_164865 [Dreissena polymorpha]
MSPLLLKLLRNNSGVHPKKGFYLHPALLNEHGPASLGPTSRLPKKNPCNEQIATLRIILEHFQECNSSTLSAMGMQLTAFDRQSFLN